MEITINVKDLLIGLVLIAAFVLLIFLIILVKHAITAVKNVNKITNDASVITSITAEKVVDLNEIIGDVKSAVTDLSAAIKGKQPLIGALMNMAKAAASAVAYMKSKEKK